LTQWAKMTRFFKKQHTVPGTIFYSLIFFSEYGIYVTMRVIRKILLVLTVILYFTECVNLKDVTQEGLDSYGADLYQNFVYFISEDITLRKTVPIKDSGELDTGTIMAQNDSGNVTLFNRHISLSKRTRGRVKKVSPQKFEVAFEELPGETRPPIITFKQKLNDKQEPNDKQKPNNKQEPNDKQKPNNKQKPNDKQERYFIDCTWEKVVILVDQKGRYGFINKEGYVISYNGIKYLLQHGNEEVIQKTDELPYLKQDLNIKIINEYRNMRGLR
jgi:hypothetical protein